MAGYKIENLSFKYNLSEKFALSDINLEIKDGEILVLCGKSGCGKSTLLRHLKSCITPHGKRTGRIYFDGRLQNDVSDKEQASRIGFVFQHPDDQIVTDKVWHELAFGLENLGENSHTIRVRVGEMASYFGRRVFEHVEEDKRRPGHNRGVVRTPSRGCIPHCRQSGSHGKRQNHNV